MWLQEGSCEDKVAMALTCVCDKIRATRVALLEWQRTSFGNTKTKIVKVRDKLGTIFEHPPAPDLHERGGVLMQQLDNLLGREETFWWQRARTQWLKEGDRNTRFFHTRASNRRRKNTIKGLRGDDVVWHDSPKGIEDTVVDNFRRIFRTQGVPCRR